MPKGIGYKAGKSKKKKKVGKKLPPGTAKESAKERFMAMKRSKGK